MPMTIAGPLADRSAWHADDCSLSRAMQVVGTRSAMLLMREAFYGTTRFDEFAERVGITQAIASARLRTLVEAGLLTKQPYRDEGQRPREEYVLTQMGRDLLPAVLGLMQWGDKYLQDAGAPVVVEDRHTRTRAHVRITNGAGDELTLDDLRLRAGRGLVRRDSSQH